VPGDDAETLDVADVATSPRIRFLFDGGENATRLRTKEAAGDTPVPSSSIPAHLLEYASGTYKPALVIEHPTDEERCVVYFGARSAKKWGKPANVPLSTHQASVAAEAKKLIALVGLPALEDTYEKTGNIHDIGKRRRVWQLAMGGTM
jgi:hypothetical protein